jgi:predicted DNA-binding transcriptional regulator AlpA
MTVAEEHPPAVARLSDAGQRLKKLADASKADPNTYVPYALLASYGVTYSRIHLMRLVGRGQFPAPVQLSARKVAWPLRQVLEWLASRPVRESTHYEKTSG